MKKQKPNSATPRVVGFLVVMLALIFLLVVLNYRSLHKAKEITSVDNLSGQRIGVCAGWESDYLLSDRDDITLLRYDDNAGCLMALGYGQIDAMAVDHITANTIMSKTTGLEMLPSELAEIGCTFYASYDAEDIMTEFNEYAAEFLKSDEYQEYADRAMEINGEYTMPDIPKVEDGTILKIGYLPDCYPESYIEAGSDEPLGYGVEMLERFAYAYGYTIEWVETSDASAGMMMNSGKIQMSASYVTDVLREDTEGGGVCHMTDPYLEVEVKVLKVADGQKLTITGEVD